MLSGIVLGILGISRDFNLESTKPGSRVLSQTQCVLFRTKKSDTKMSKAERSSWVWEMEVEWPGSVSQAQG